MQRIQRFEQAGQSSGGHVKTEDAPSLPTASFESSRRHISRFKNFSRELVCSLTYRDVACHFKLQVWHDRPAMAAWRPMADGDIAAVARIAAEVHRDLPESDAVFRERLRLYPAGCLVLADGDQVCGYVVSHPIRHGRPPALDSLLGEIAPDADQYYIHDLAILPGFRRRGLAAPCIRQLLRLAASRYRTTCLVSVYGTAPFWARYGFAPASVDAPLEEKLRGYGGDAVYLVRDNHQGDTALRETALS